MAPSASGFLIVAVIGVARRETNMPNDESWELPNSQHMCGET